jgi:hypothetical protein
MFVNVAGATEKLRNLAAATAPRGATPTVTPSRSPPDD